MGAVVLVRIELKEILYYLWKYENGEQRSVYYTRKPANSRSSEKKTSEEANTFYRILFYILLVSRTSTIPYSRTAVCS